MFMSIARRRRKKQFFTLKHLSLLKSWFPHATVRAIFWGSIMWVLWSTRKGNPPENPYKGNWTHLLWFTLILAWTVAPHCFQTQIRKKIRPAAGFLDYTPPPPPCREKGKKKGGGITQGKGLFFKKELKRGKCFGLLGILLNIFFAKGLF